jgi:hypothetical protein
VKRKTIVVFIKLPLKSVTQGRGCRIIDGLEWSGGQGMANTSPIRINLCRNKLQTVLQHSELRALRSVQGLGNGQIRRKVVEKFVVKPTDTFDDRERIKENHNLTYLLRLNLGLSLVS